MFLIFFVEAKIEMIEKFVYWYVRHLFWTEKKARSENEYLLKLNCSRHIQ